MDSVNLTDEGLLIGSQAVLLHMGKNTDGRPSLALDADETRLLALLSVAGGRPLPAHRVVPAIEAAASHWYRGDKALANLRLIFAGLPRLRTLTDADNVVLAGSILDAGMTPQALMRSLWPDAATGSLDKYSADEPRVPAGHADGGQWTFGPDGAPRPTSDPRPIVVAGGEGPPEDEKTFREREISGSTTPGEEVSHDRPVLPTIGLLTGVGQALDVEIEVPLSRFAEAAQHVLDAQAAGQPSVLTIARSLTQSNRAAATGGMPKVPNLHLDEYPPAMFAEGGASASVRPINPTDNRAQGAYVGNLCPPHPDGSKVKIKVVP